MTLTRALWITIAVACAALGVFVLAEPMLQISSCELGLFPDNGVNHWSDCTGSVREHFGTTAVALAALPVVIALLPAIVSKRWIAWATAVILTVGPLLALTAKTPLLQLLAYYLPVGLIAVLMAATPAALRHRRAPEHRS